MDNDIRKGGKVMNIPQIKPDELDSIMDRVKRENPDINTQKKPDEKPVFMQEIPNIPTHSNLSQININARKPKRSRVNKKAVLVIAGILLIFFVYNLISGIYTYSKVNILISHTKAVKAALVAKNLGEVKQKTQLVNNDLKALQKVYKLFSWAKPLPIIGKYVVDGSHLISAGIEGTEASNILVDAATPYADLLGFGASAGKEETAADRIDFIVKAIPDLVPKLDELEKKMEIIDKEFSYINPNDYPEKIKGKVLRENLVKYLDIFDQAASFVKNGKPLIAKAPYLLGLDRERTYMVIFQNDKELRSTGGFITAYSIMKVDKAKFNPVESNDIYNLDSKYKPTIEAPQPIIDYIKGPYVLSKKLRLRDMNWDPNFPTSMETFSKEVESVGIPKVDGIIAVDTQVLVYLLDVLGSVGVSGYGNFSNEIVKECNCPQVIYELESFADVEGPVVWDPAGTGKIIYAPPNMDNRKKIIGPLMNAIMSNAFGQPKEKIPALFEAAYKSVLEKHILFYFFDKDAQTASEKFGSSGVIRTDFEGDYLHINDSNLGGRKSNMYVTQEVNQEIKVNKDGTIEKTLSITYKNPEKQDGWLNSVLPNWVRIYVPKGSELISVDGLQDQADPYVEYDKTVFAGYFELRPQGVVKINLKYKLPFKLKNDYRLLIQKQPGTNTPLYTILYGKKEEELQLVVDKELRLKI